MKKKIVILLFVILVLVSNLIQGSSLSVNKESTMALKELEYNDIVDKLIRFHVIANSDSKEDQALKLKVRDRVIQELEVKLSKAKDIEDAKKILNDNIDEVNSIAEEVIRENNYDYEVKTMLSNENFPDKIYGDYIFPQGNYLAFRIIIGSGEGQNWWCVMFPPLCFVDESKNTVNSKELEKNIEDEISSTKDEKNNSKDSDTKKSDKENKVVFKFKVFDIIKKIFD